MKALNEKASKIFLELIAIMEAQNCDLEEGQEPFSHIKIDFSKGVYMPLCFEKLTDFSFVGREATSYSMAHYYESHGDLVPDPDMVFFLVHSSKKIYPASFQNALAYKEGIYLKDDGKWYINKKEQADEAYFANIWLKNIQVQQGIF